MYVVKAEAEIGVGDGVNGIGEGVGDGIDEVGTGVGVGVAALFLPPLQATSKSASIRLHMNRLQRGRSFACCITDVSPFIYKFCLTNLSLLYSTFYFERRLHIQGLRPYITRKDRYPISMYSGVSR